ncbi:MAG: tetratricopeptide repeat protein [Candidatus Eisenbacteria bacterium]|jgi:signal transduction histidine kinase/tetratricopeptide (TPR) repeat protein|nr:tetratricopeptide repeat protein [Candidatus Eisenbacteria bacterium]
MIWLSFLVCAPQAGARTAADSLAGVLRGITSDTARVFVLNSLAFESHRTDPQRTRAYAQEALDLASRLGLTSGIARSHQVFGIYHWVQGDYQESLRSHLTSLALYESLGDSSGLARAFNNIGAVYYSRSLYDEALEYFLRALNIYERRPITPEVAYIYINIGIIMRLQQNYDEALSYYFKALEFYKQEGYDRDRASAFSSIGAVYLDRLRYEDALEYYHKALEIRTELGDKSGISACLQSMGVVHQRLGRVETALEDLSQALEIARTLGNRNLMATTRVVLGTMLLQLQRFDQARENLEEGLHLAFEIGARRVAMDACRGLTEVASAQGDYRSALRLHQQYAALGDSIYNAEKTQAIEDMRAKYESEKLEREILELHLAGERKDEELNRRQDELSKQRIVIYAFGAVFVTIAVFSSLLYRQLSLNKRYTALLAEQNKKLMHQQELLNRQTGELLQLNATKDRFFAIIAHDLRSPLASLLSTTRSLATCCDGLDISTLQQYMETINGSARRLHRLLENLLQWATAQTGAIQKQPATVRVSEVVDEILAALSDAADAKAVALSSTVPPTLVVVADLNMLRVALRNLVDNAIKFSFRGSEVLVGAATTGGETEIIVTDRGVGIPEADLGNLFQLDRSPRTRGTIGEQGSGLGLTLCRDFVVEMGGRIWAVSRQGEGSSFHIILPSCAG